MSRSNFEAAVSGDSPNLIGRGYYVNIGSLRINVHDANETAGRRQAEKTFSGTLRNVDAARKSSASKEPKEPATSRK